MDLAIYRQKIGVIEYMVNVITYDTIILCD
jgi:hypothetical protein